jgi:hypothetical protein
MTYREAAIVKTALGVLCLYLSGKLVETGATLLAEALGAVFVENVTAPESEGSSNGT